VSEDLPQNPTHASIIVQEAWSWSHKTACQASGWSKEFATASTLACVHCGMQALNSTDAGFAAFLFNLWFIVGKEWLIHVTVCNSALQLPWWPDGMQRNQPLQGHAIPHCAILLNVCLDQSLLRQTNTRLFAALRAPLAMEALHVLAPEMFSKLWPMAPARAKAGLSWLAFSLLPLLHEDLKLNSGQFSQRIWAHRGRRLLEGGRIQEGREREREAWAQTYLYLSLIAATPTLPSWSAGWRVGRCKCAYICKHARTQTHTRTHTRTGLFWSAESVLKSAESWLFAASGNVKRAGRELQVGQDAGRKEMMDRASSRTHTSKSGILRPQNLKRFPLHVKYSFVARQARGPGEPVGRDGDAPAKTHTGHQLAWLLLITNIDIPDACTWFAGLRLSSGKASAEWSLTERPVGSAVCTISRLFDHPPMQQPLSNVQNSSILDNRCDGTQASVRRQFD